MRAFHLSTIQVGSILRAVVQWPVVHSHHCHRSARDPSHQQSAARPRTAKWRKDGMHSTTVLGKQAKCEGYWKRTYITADVVARPVAVHGADHCSALVALRRARHPWARERRPRNNKQHGGFSSCKVRGKTRTGTLKAHSETLWNKNDAPHPLRAVPGRRLHGVPGAAGPSHRPCTFIWTRCGLHQRPTRRRPCRAGIRPRRLGPCSQALRAWQRRRPAGWSGSARDRHGNSVQP